MEIDMKVKSGLGVFDLDNIIEWENFKNSEPHSNTNQQLTVIDLKTDVLEIAVAYKRNRVNISETVYAIEHCTVKYDMIEPQDRELARQIRSFYEFKFFNKKLSGRKLSSYQSVIVECLRDTTSIYKVNVPAIVKLVDFYEFDIEMQKLFDSHTPITDDNKDMTGEHILTHVKTLELSRKNTNGNQVYHFFTTPRKHLLMYKESRIDKSNNALSFLFDNFKTFEIEKYAHLSYVVKNYPDTEYGIFQIQNFNIKKIVKE